MVKSGLETEEGGKRTGLRSERNQRNIKEDSGNDLSVEEQKQWHTFEDNSGNTSPIYQQSLLDIKFYSNWTLYSSQIQSTCMTWIWNYITVNWLLNNTSLPKLQLLVLTQSAACTASYQMVMVTEAAPDAAGNSLHSLGPVIGDWSHLQRRLIPPNKPDQPTQQPSFQPCRSQLQPSSVMQLCLSRSLLYIIPIFWWRVYMCLMI